MTSPDPTWRVYLAEWLIVFTSSQDGEPGKLECESHYAEKYAGRVRMADWRVVPAIMGRLGAAGPQCLQLLLPNLKGEYKDEADAWRLSGELMTLDAGPKPHVARRGSSVEQAMLDYGRKLLPVQAGGGDQA